MTQNIVQLFKKVRATKEAVAECSDESFLIIGPPLPSKVWLRPELLGHRFLSFRQPDNAHYILAAALSEQESFISACCDSQY